MFDNVLFQKSACSELAREVQSKTLAPAILIYGPALSGKSTVALELARILTCQNTEKRGNWTCNCWCCQQQRELSQNQVLVMGNSDFIQEISVCRKFFEQAWQRGLNHKQLRILLLVWLRSLNKVLKRYDEVLWQGAKNKTEKERKAQKVQEEFVELLAKLRPRNIFAASDGVPSNTELIFHDKKILEKDLNRCQELAGILIEAIPQGIPIDQIRQLQQWSYQTSQTSKIAILENVDLMNTMASNAMLKLLEEPPHNCFFILTTQHKQALLPTVLSRLRLVGLRERSPEEELEIVKRIFRTDKPQTLKELFLTGKQEFAEMQAECHLFMQSLREKRPFFTLRSSLDKLDLGIFLQNLGFILHRECTEQHQKADQLLAEHNFFWYQRFLQVSRNAVERNRVYHEPALLLLQNLYLELLDGNSI